VLWWSGSVKDIRPVKPVPVIPRGSLPEQVKERDPRGTGGWLRLTWIKAVNRKYSNVIFFYSIAYAWMKALLPHRLIDWCIRIQLVYLFTVLFIWVLVVSKSKWSVYWPYLSGDVPTVIYPVYAIQPVVIPVEHNRLSNRLNTTSWMLAYTMQPVVHPVGQPVVQPVLSCTRSITFAC